MPPKAKAQGTSKKADQKKKERVIEVSGKNVLLMHNIEDMEFSKK